MSIITMKSRNGQRSQSFDEREKKRAEILAGMGWRVASTADAPEPVAAIDPVITLPVAEIVTPEEAAPTSDLTQNTAITKTIAKALIAAGIGSLYELGQVTDDELLKITGIDPRRLGRIRLSQGR